MPLGIPAEGWVFDTALAAYLLDATAGSYELPRLTMKYCGFQPYEGDSSGSGQMSLLDEEDSTREQDNARWASLCASLACLRPVLDEQLKALGMDRLYYDIELPLCQVLADMETQGFLVDKSALYQFGQSLTGTIDALQRSIWDMAGEEFNINSPKQLGAVLFEKLMLPAGKKTKTGWSTNADILEKLRDKHPIINQILDYRMLTKLKSTYADGLLKVISPDGRIHTSFQMTVTATGRLSSTEPNLQNIPIRKELGSQIRSMFVAPEGKLLVDADYSQIELRLLSHISGDQVMIDAFKSGEDIHAVTASQVFGVPLHEVTPLQRSRAKAVNFGIVYGISAWSLAQDIGVFPSEAKAYMDAYLEKYHGVRDYMKKIVEQARADGYVSTLYGRRRALPELKSASFPTRSFGERVALNMPIQGTAADVIKLAMVNVYRALKAEGLRSRLILQVHDELIAECPADEAEQVRQLIEREMERAATFSVPLTAKAAVGKSWAEAH
jgi:DNA polymerase-1